VDRFELGVDQTDLDQRRDIAVGMDEVFKV